jgi:hypothetical protein
VDNEYRIDLGEVLGTVRGAEVIIFRFMTTPQRLLVDFRHTDVDAPLVKAVPRAESTEDRFKSIKMLRPRFRLPRKISAVWWPRSIDALYEAGVWNAIVQRVVEAGFPDAVRACDDVLDELRRLERAEFANAIAGEGYRTLWPATSQS